MKLTKTQLKQIIKEELDAVNEVSIIDVAAMSDVERLMIVVKALGKMASTFGPVALLGIAGLAVKKALRLGGKKDPSHDEMQAIIDRYDKEQK